MEELLLQTAHLMMVSLWSFLAQIFTRKSLKLDFCAELISSLSSTDSVLNKLSEATKYTALVYYEEKGVEDLVTFTAAKDLNALLQVNYYDSYK